MKNSYPKLLLLTLLMLFSHFTHAQAWERNSKVLSLGFGASRFFHLDNYYYDRSDHGRNWYWHTTGQLNFQGEFGVHRYIGLGFTTGVGGRAGSRYGYSGEVNIPIGMILNFHFFQLIADKTGKNIHADQVDVYAGLNLGSGIALTYYNDQQGSRLVPLAFGGLQVGVRYFFTPKVGVNAEVGFGKSLVNLGFSFKL